MPNETSLPPASPVLANEHEHVEINPGRVSAHQVWQPFREPKRPRLQKLAICGFAARIVATAMIVLSLVIVFVAAFYFDTDAWWSYAAIAAGILLMGFGVALLWYCSALPDRAAEGGVGASLLGSAPFILGLSAAVTIVTYVLPVSDSHHDWWTGWVNFIAPAVGLFAGGVFAAALAISGRGRGSADQANPALYGELMRHWETLNTRVCALCGISTADAPAIVKKSVDRQVACAIARAQCNFIGREFGLMPSADGRVKTAQGMRWVAGTGYIEVWTRLHDAEEALFAVDSDETVFGHGLHDEMRVKDSNIRNEDDFLFKLRRAVLVLGGGDYLTPAPPLPQLSASDTAELGKRRARAALRDVRNVVNQFRDGRREALVRGRNHLAAVGMLTGLTAYGLLALAVLVDAPADGIMAATAFYLVGALVGMFDQLRLTVRGRTPTEEDYGLERARLVYAPILSGLAAVSGVVLTASLYATLSGPVIVYPEQGAPSTAVTQVASVEATGASTGSGNLAVVAQVSDLETPPLNRIFDLDGNRFGLVIAAVFGLTPGLLVSRLQGQADRIKADLRSTTAPENSSSGVG